MSIQHFNREEAIEAMKSELSPFVVATDKGSLNDPIRYKIYSSLDDDSYIEHGEFVYSDYSKPKIFQPRLVKIKKFLINQ